MRQMGFGFEKDAINEIMKYLEEQLRHCKELQGRAKDLAEQNLQLVETLTDDHDRAVLLFTIITVIFLPLSFVAGLFGMNLAGISNTTSKVSLFWYIATPFTVTIIFLCLAFVRWGGVGVVCHH